jgi:hypothetical protein
MPIVLRLIQGGSSRKILGNFRRVEKIGAQKFVEQKFRPGESVGHLSQTSGQIQKAVPGLLLESLFVGELLLDHGSGQGGQRDLVGRSHFFQVVIGIRRDPNPDLSFRSHFSSSMIFGFNREKTAPSSRGGLFFDPS